MKNIIDFILESKGQRISKRSSNHPYDVKDDKLLKKRDSRPERAQQLRKTKIDDQVLEFCSSLVNDFIVKFYKLTANNESLLHFNSSLAEILKIKDKDNALNNIRTYISNNIDDACVFLNYDDDNGYHEVILTYNNTDSFTTILNKLEIKYIIYWFTGFYTSKLHIDKEDTGILYLKYEPKFFASVLHKLRKHDLAKKAENKKIIDLFELFNDVTNNYSKNYFADKFKEFETAYNDVLANW